MSESCKRCPKCGETKPLGLFPIRRSNKDGRYTYCKTCSVANARAYYVANRVKAQLKGKQRWAQSTPEQKRRHRNCCAVRIERIRQKIWDRYGRTCACCGEDNQGFLTLDHIEGNGSKERRETGRSGVGFYHLLLRRGLPEGFQTLCFNCNCAKHRYGVCPHQQQVSALIESARVTIG